MRFPRTPRTRSLSTKIQTTTTTTLFKLTNQFQTANFCSIHSRLFVFIINVTRQLPGDDIVLLVFVLSFLFFRILVDQSPNGPIVRSDRNQLGQVLFSSFSFSVFPFFFFCFWFIFLIFFISEWCY